VDALIDRVVAAQNRAELVAATKALDRVLLWNHYVVPQWTYPNLRTARWNKFGRPPLMPKYGVAAFPTIWWWDEQQLAAGAEAANSCQSAPDCATSGSGR
jgi:microcin C transport system substrate-binding protein